MLLVDDEEGIVKVEKQMLERFGFDVVATRSTLEALEIFRFQPDRFDLVITDLTMSGMTGIELAQELLKMRPHLPIILSAHVPHRLSRIVDVPGGCR